MSKNNNLPDFLKDIADTIRQIKDSPDLINAQDFSDKIKQITGTYPEKVVNFYDYDGVLLYSFSKEEAESMDELPPLPTRNGLICQEWNWTLDAIKEYMYKYGKIGHVDVGATYITDDGSSRLYVTIKSKNTSVNFGTVTSDDTFLIDFGDGNKHTVDKIKLEHNYLEPGDYVITIKPQSNTLCTIRFYENNILTKIELGSNAVLNIDGTQTLLEHIVLPNNSQFTTRNEMPLLKFLIIPKLCTLGRILNGCWHLNKIILSSTLQEISFWSGNQYMETILPNSFVRNNNDFLRNITTSKYIIPENTLAIGSMFMPQLTELYCFPKVAPTISSVTGADAGILYVPGGCLDSYLDIKNKLGDNWTIQEMYTPTECISLSITAEDVSGRKTSTTISYTAVTNGIDLEGNPMTGVTLTGTATSAEFPQNTSETDTVERTITFEYMGVTASTTITQGVWVNQYYTVDLNNQWRLSSSISNPDSVTYDGVYESFSNTGKDSSAALMYIDITGYTDFSFYVRSNAESSFDYVVVSNLDCTLNNETTSGSNVKMTTSSKQNNDTTINGYTKVDFTGIDCDEHRITVMYRKDSSSASGTDRGYVLIPKEQ